MSIPYYLSLIGDEHGGVELDCHKCAVSQHNATYWPIAYHAGRGASDHPDLPYFAHTDLSGLFKFAVQHAAIHSKDTA